MIRGLYRNRKKQGSNYGRQRQGFNSYNKIQDHMRRNYGDLIGYESEEQEPEPEQQEYSQPEQQEYPEQQDHQGYQEPVQQQQYHEPEEEQDADDDTNAFIHYGHGHQDDDMS